MQPGHWAAPRQRHQEQRVETSVNFGRRVHSLGVACSSWAERPKSMRTRARCAQRRNARSHCAPQRCNACSRAARA
eukprot:5646939-Lingulodinium_polyedra.AAC.1